MSDRDKRMKKSQIEDKILDGLDRYNNASTVERDILRTYKESYKESSKLKVLPKDVDEIRAILNRDLGYEFTYMPSLGEFTFKNKQIRDKAYDDLMIELTGDYNKKIRNSIKKESFKEYTIQKGSRVLIDNPQVPKKFYDIIDISNDGKTISIKDNNNKTISIPISDVKKTGYEESYKERLQRLTEDLDTFTYYVGREDALNKEMERRKRAFEKGRAEIIYYPKIENLRIEDGKGLSGILHMMVRFNNGASNYGSYSSGKKYIGSVYQTRVAINNSQMNNIYDTDDLADYLNKLLAGEAKRYIEQNAHKEFDGMPIKGPFKYLY